MTRVELEMSFEMEINVEQVQILIEASQDVFGEKK